MIQRRAQEIVANALRRQAAVALIGPRQVGKTTLAQTIVDRTDALYLDLESSADRGKLADARLYPGRTDRVRVAELTPNPPQRAVAYTS